MDYKRQYCNKCERPQSACLCTLVIERTTSVEVVIWQHPSEAGRAKGTAKLLHLCLPNSRLICGERLSPADLSLNLNDCALLYPASDTAVVARAGVSTWRQLLLLDGTWRKSRKLLYLNPWLNSVPRVALPQVQAKYRIRKPEKQHQLSTFEAAVHGLAVLEGDASVQPLWTVFDQFLQQYESFVGRS